MESAALVQIQPTGIVSGISPDRMRELIEAFLMDRSPRTIKAYKADLEDFRTFLGADDLDGATRALLSRGPGEANHAVLRYKSGMIERGLQPSTVNRRLAAVRSLVKMARTLGMVSWGIEIKNQKAESYRDTKGPGRRVVRKMLNRLDQKRNTRKANRDRAILRLLYDLGLRRSEVVGLDVEDVNLEAGTVAVLGKGRTAKELLTLPKPTGEVLRAWLEVRGQDPGPLFVNFDHRPGSTGKRLTDNGLYSLVKTLAKEVGSETRPHGLRHSAITEALDATGGDVRAVQKFSRHKNINTLLLYDDRREDKAGAVAAMVADRL